MRKFHLLFMALFIAGNSFGEAVAMVSKSGKMEHVPLHAVPLRLEDGSFVGCAVAQSRIADRDMTNKRSDAFFEFNAILSRNEFFGGDVRNEWNILVNVKRYEHREVMSPAYHIEDVVCGSGAGKAMVFSDAKGVTAFPKWLSELTGKEFIFASGAVSMGRYFQLDDGREVAIRRYADKMRTIVLYAVAVWTDGSGKLSVYTAYQIVKDGCMILEKPAFRKVLDRKDWCHCEKSVYEYSTDDAILKVKSEDNDNISFSVLNETCFAQFNIWKGLITTLDRQVQVLP